MRSWKKRWERELDEMIPPLFEQSSNKEVRVSKKHSFFSWFSLHKKRVCACLASAFVAAACCFSLPYFLSFPDSSSSDSQPPESTANGYTMVGIEINPAAVFCVDGNGAVVSVLASNADADLILNNEARREEMTGKTVEQAVQVFVDYAAQLGFLEFSQTSAVRVTGCTDEAPVDSVCSAVEAYFKRKGALGVVVDRALEWDVFCEDFQIPKNKNLEETAENAASLSVLYMQRSEDWESSYKELVESEMTAAAQAVRREYQEQIVEYLIGAGIPETLLEFVLNNYTDEEIVQLAKQLHLEVPISEELLSYPQNEKEYEEKIRTYFTQRYETRLSEHKEMYQAERPTIEEKDYKQYVDEVIAEYGSLESYWEERKQNKKGKDDEKNNKKNDDDVQQKP